MSFLSMYVCWIISMMWNDVMYWLDTALTLEWRRCEKTHLLISDIQPDETQNYTHIFIVTINVRIFSVFGLVYHIVRICIILYASMYRQTDIYMGPILIHIMWIFYCTTQWQYFKVYIQKIFTRALYTTCNLGICLDGQSAGSRVWSGLSGFAGTLTNLSCLPY